MSWRDAPVPGHAALPAGAPRTDTQPGPAAPLRAYLSTAVAHERDAATQLSTRVRVALTITALLDVLCAIALYWWVRPAQLQLVDGIVSWGGHWALVSGIALVAGAVLVGLGCWTSWFARATNPQLYALWAAGAGSVVTTGVALAVAIIAAVVFAVLCIIGAMVIFGFFWALATGDS